MNSIIIDAGRPEACQPLTCTRGLGEVQFGSRTLHELQAGNLIKAGLAVTATTKDNALTLFQNGAAWVQIKDLERLKAAGTPLNLNDAAGNILAWVSPGTVAAPSSLAAAIQAEPGSLLLEYSWSLLQLNEILINVMNENHIEGELSAGVHIEGFIALGTGSRLLPGVFIEGNAVIGRNCKIGPNCYIRGATAIADNCHIGQAVEIKNSIVMADVSIGHLSYCGDSIIGAGTNLGAGTITANFRHDGMNHRSCIGTRLVDTGRRKFGAIIGDNVHTGIHTGIYPGRKLWPGTCTLPGSIVRKDLH